MVKLFYDVFISHAYEDKTGFANELALALKKKGLKVWYSGFELTLGTPISASVNQALRESKFGIVIISPVYLKKNWAMKELEALFAQETERNRILPILHKINIDEIRERLPMLADRYAVSSKNGIQNVVDRVYQTVKSKRKYTKKQIPEEKKKKAPGKNKKNQGMHIRNAGVIVLGDAKTTIGNASGGDMIINKSKK